MQHTKPNRRAHESGFTLIELLLVLAILVVLGGIATQFFQGTREGADIDAAKGEISILESNIKIYEMHMREYPEKLEDLIKKPSGDNAEKWRGPYGSENEDFMDPWDNPYKISSPGKNNSQSFDLWSTGKDGQDGTDDDIGNW